MVIAGSDPCATDLSASKASMRVFGLGACLLSGPLSEGIRRDLIGRAVIGRGGPTPGTYSFGEMFQLLDFLEGKIDIPAEYRSICGYKETYAPGPGASGFTGADVCLIEPNGVVDIDFRGLKLNRAQVQALLARLKQISRPAAKAASRWYAQGLLACNDALQKEIATELIAAMPDDFTDRAFIEAVLTEAEGMLRDVADDLAQLRRRIPIPIGLIAYAYQYLPDGRPVFWPPDLQEQIKTAAAQLGMPYIEPWRLVLEHGGEPVLKPDLRHYREEFIPTISTLFARFAAEVAAAAPATSQSSAKE